MNAVLNEHRNRYLAHFAETVAQARGAHDSYCTELLLQPGNRSDPEPAFILYRIDIAAKAGERTKLIDANVDPIAVGTSLTGFPAPVHVDRLAWNDVEVTVRGNSAPFAEIAEWSRKWMDLDDKRQVGDDGMQGVVHSVARPEEDVALGYRVNVDMGSAPVDALEELIVIVARGAESVELTSSTGPQPGPNSAIQLSGCVVTPRACARVAPTHPATDRERWADGTGLRRWRAHTS